MKASLTGIAGPHRSSASAYPEIGGQGAFFSPLVWQPASRARPASIITVSGSTLSGNGADLGGAVYADGVVAVSDSTVSGNTALTSEGGGFRAGAGGTVVRTSGIFCRPSWGGRTPGIRRVRETGPRARSGLARPLIDLLGQRM